MVNLNVSSQNFPSKKDIIKYKKFIFPKKIHHFSFVLLYQKGKCKCCGIILFYGLTFVNIPKQKFKYRNFSKTL